MAGENDIGFGKDPFRMVTQSAVKSPGSTNTVGVVRDTPTGNSQDAAASAAASAAQNAAAYNNLQQGLSIQAQKNFEATNKISKDEIKARLKIAQMQIGSANQNAAAQIAVEREKLQLAREEMERLGIPRLELDRWQAEKENELATAALDLDKERLAFEKDKSASELEFEKAKWRDQNANATRELDFNERKWAQELDFEREREAGRLGLDRDKFVADAREQDRRYALDLQAQGFQVRQYDQDFAESQRRYNQDFGEDARRYETDTALRVAETAAKMGGPGDWANYLDYTEGVQNTGNVPVFMQRLLGNTAAGGGAATGAAPASKTLAGVAANLAGVPLGAAMPGAAGAMPSESSVGGPAGAAQNAAAIVRANPPSNGGGWNDRDLAVLGQIEQIYAQPGKVQGYEQMSDDEKSFLEGGAKKVGQSRNVFETKYAQSRVGQGSARG